MTIDDKMTLDNSLINDPFLYSYTMDYNNSVSFVPVTSYYGNMPSISKVVSLN